MQNMERLFIWATLFVVAPTARQGSRDSMERTEEANASVSCAGYAHVGLVLKGKRACGTASNREMQMMSDARRLVRPGAVAQRSTAQTAAYQYCQVTREEYDALRCIELIE
jgi:uncharacterized protein YaiE (UPF0345 family)